MVAIIALLTMSCSNKNAQAQSSTSYMDIYITIDGKTLPIHLVDNSATRELVAALQQNPITYEASDYGGFEKVGGLGRSLPTSNSQITTEAGDVILYSGNQIVLFYGSNSWSYTRLGRIEYQSLDELKTFLKAEQGRVNVTLSIDEVSGISQMIPDKEHGKIYALNGTELKHEPRKGIYIKNGKKRFR
ncbi:MAG: hypothetical protein J6129_06995 [Bacteroidaceae bacterium]|nr:hypothetical protein [Bacteroidaceae bacterium]